MDSTSSSRRLDPPATSPNRFRELRLSRGLTRAELSARSGLTVAGIGRIERGEVRPLLGTAVLIAAALGCKPADLRGPR